MGMAIKMIIGGAGAAMFGLSMFFNGIVGDDPNGAAAGGWWRGALIFVLGVACAVFGVKMLNDESTPPE